MIWLRCFLFLCSLLVTTAKLEVVYEKDSISLLPQAHDAVVILMHGLGDTGESYISIAKMLAKELSKVKFILPSAPRQPVTLNRGAVMNSWYDIVNLEDKDGGRCDGLVESASRIRAILQKEYESGIPYHRMMLSGFSQGGAMSLFTGLQLNSDQGLAGIICLSGYLPCPKKFELERNIADTPILHVHGLADKTVQFKWAEETYSGLREMGVTNYKLETFERLTHSINREGISLVMNFMLQRFNVRGLESDETREL